MPQRSCGTCRDRRILCDRTTPICTQCSKSGLTCQGYGLRVSWPNVNDRRRAMVGKPARTRKVSRRISDTLHINASSWDIEMHYHLLGLVSDKYTKLVLQAPMPFNPFKLCVQNTYLFNYFQYTASRSLTTLGHDPTSMGSLLIRIASTSNGPSSTAVLHSLLALSSLHLYGLQDQAGELKLSALKALAAASRTSIGPVEAAQHVAAGMLLCSFEIHRASCTSGQWRCYISGVKKILSASSSGVLDQDSGFNMLLDWVYYHDVLSRFSELHWRSDKDMPSAPACTAEYPRIRAIPLNPSAFDTGIQLLSDLCDAVAAKPAPTAPAKQRTEYMTYLKILAWKIQTLPIPPHTNPNTNPPECATMAKLFQLSMLIYLNRATENAIEPVHKTEQRVRQGLSLLAKLGTCERQFPVFVLGCEARTDDERCVVLDLIARTERSVASRSLYLVERLVKAIWVQDDLANGELGYMAKLSAMISSCTILPTFV